MVRYNYNERIEFYFVYPFSIRYYLKKKMLMMMVYGLVLGEGFQKRTK